MLVYAKPCGAVGRYTVSRADYVWLLRAVAAEGPVQTQVAQALVNCFCRSVSKSNYAGTLADLIRAYAQPVNPDWYLDGDKYKKSKLFGTDTGVAAARRRESVHSVLTKFTPDVYEAVRTALEVGITDIPANCTDYAAPRVITTKPGYVLLSTDKPRGRNWLWTRDAKWDGYIVR